MVDKPLRMMKTYCAAPNNNGTSVDDDEGGIVVVSKRKASTSSSGSSRSNKKQEVDNNLEYKVVENERTGLRMKQRKEEFAAPRQRK